MDTCAIVLPDQLYEGHPALRGVRDVMLIEHEAYFRRYRYHKKKLALHRASMKAWADGLDGRKWRVRYIEAAETERGAVFERLIRELGVRQVRACRFEEAGICAELAGACEKCGAKVEWEDSPNFLNTPGELEGYFTGREHYAMTPFYIAQRKQRGILVTRGQKPAGEKWSFDPENRKRLGADVEVPEADAMREDKYLREACEYIERRFGKNPGEVGGLMFPHTRGRALALLEDFLERRLAKFGPYEDAISREHRVLFHSRLSAPLNIGLLNPGEVIERTLAFAKEHKVPRNSVEGFVRQILGWREFMRGVYHFQGARQREHNYFGCDTPLPAGFYSGQTGIGPVDHVIAEVMENAYAHHIERLMVLGNFMLLCEIRPAEVFRWFMELFIDAYDWVMVPNVYGMSQYSDGGMITTKPYISSSNYIRKMSNFEAGGWCETWDGLYWRFVDRHRETFETNPRMGFTGSLLRRMGAKKLREHRKRAEMFLERLL